jgi:hypothetical protein
MRFGEAACLIDTNGEAPVPPSDPEIVITSASALATPTAMVPTPGSLTSFTETRAVGLNALRS